MGRQGIGELLRLAADGEFAALVTVDQGFAHQQNVTELPLWCAVTALAVGCSLLANGRLVMKYGMRRLATGAAVTIALASVPA